MEYKIRTANTAFVSEFSPAIQLYSGARCPPVQTLQLLEEDPDFVTVNWMPPTSTGYAPFIMYYEVRYDASTTDLSNTLDDGKWVQLSNVDLYWDVAKVDVRTLGVTTVYYTVRAVTHVGKGTMATVQGEVAL